MTFEHPAERIIRDAIDAGAFEDLAGAGKPIPGAGSVDDDLWWVRDWVARQREDASPYLPPSASAGNTAPDSAGD